MAERTDHFKALGKHKTAGNYSCALKHFMQFRQEKDIALEELTSGTMKDFQTHRERIEDEYHIIVQQDIEGGL